MARAFNQFVDSAFGFVKSTKETYEGQSRFMKMRIWIVAVLAIDAMVTLGFVFVAGGHPNVVAWYQPGFPANMLVVRNEGGYLKDATLVLDNRYTYAVERIDKGLNGFDVNHAFRDKDDFTPPESYRPRELEIRVKNDAVKVLVGAQNPGG
jgi:hypothetical protein